MVNKDFQRAQTFTDYNNFPVLDGLDSGSTPSDSLMCYISALRQTSQYSYGPAVVLPEFCVRGHRFGFVKRPKILNVYRTTPASTLYSQEYMRYCTRPVCHSHTIIK